MPNVTTQASGCSITVSECSKASVSGSNGNLFAYLMSASVVINLVLSGIIIVMAICKLTNCKLIFVFNVLKIVADFTKIRKQ